MKKVYGTRRKESNLRMSDLPLSITQVIKPINSRLLYSLTGHIVDLVQGYVVFCANEICFYIDKKYFNSLEITSFAQFSVDGYITFDEKKDLLMIRDCTVYESRVNNKQRGTPFTDLHSMKGIILQTSNVKQGTMAWIFGLYVEMQINYLPMTLESFSWCTIFFFEDGNGFSLSEPKDIPFKQKVDSNNLMIYSPVLHTVDEGKQVLWSPLFGYLEWDKNLNIFSGLQQDYYYNFWVERAKYACEDAKWKITSTSKELSNVVEIADCLRLCTMADNSRLPNLLRKMVIDKISRLNNNLASADEDVEKDTVVSLPPSLKRGREGAVADTPTTHIVVINKCKEANGATPGFESSAIKKQKTCEKEEGNDAIVEDIKPPAFNSENDVFVLDNETNCDGSRCREGDAIVPDLSNGLKEELIDNNFLQSDEPPVEEDDDLVHLEAVCLRALDDKYLLMYSTSISLPYFAVEKNCVYSPIIAHWYKLGVLRNYTLLEKPVNGRAQLIVFNVKVCESLSADTSFKPPIKCRSKKNRVELHLTFYVGNRSPVDGCVYCYSVELPPIIDTACVISKNASGEFSAWCALRNFPYRGTEWTLVSSFRKKGAKLGANKKEAIVKQEADVVWVRNSISTTTPGSIETPSAGQISSVPNSVSRKVPSNFNSSQEYTGFICSSMSANEDYYVIHCRELKLNALLEKKKFTNKVYVNPIGEWIRFTGKEVNGVLHVQKYDIVSPECTTMPTFSQLLISCEVTVPRHFDTRTVLTTDHVAEVYIVDETIVAGIQPKKKLTALVACDVECKANDPNELKFQLIHLRGD